MREPPDWALPSWDAVPAGAAPTAATCGRSVVRVATRRRPTRVRPRRRARSGSGSSASARSPAPIRGAVRSDPRLSDLWVEGEIGRVTISSAGHAYFALKDERNQLQCVWFRDDRLRSAFEAQAGLRVVAHGRIDLFEPQGALQLYVESIQPAGLGDLTLRFEALKARLAAEGLFEAARKRPLPTRPATIAVITSPTGAVWKDICHVLARRWPLTRVVLVAAQVQGESAPASLVGAFRKVERYAAARIAAGRPDEAPAVTILARGGGSLEDLWAFNDEAVVRAVVGAFGAGRLRRRPRGRRDAVRLRGRRPRSDAVRGRRDRRPRSGRVPGRGPEWRTAPGRRGRDAPVGRRRARSSPSVARSIGSARSPSWRVRASGSGCSLDRATRAISGELAGRRRRVEQLGVRLGPTLPGRLARDRSRLGRGDVLDGLAVGRVAIARSALGAASAALAVLGPQATLDRGYAIVRRADDGRIVRDPADAAPGTRLALRVAQGELPATADER